MHARRLDSDAQSSAATGNGRAIGSAASLFFWFVLLLLGTWLTVAA